MPATNDYHRTIADARRFGLALSGRMEAVLLALLRDYADTLSREILTALGADFAAADLLRTRAVVEEIIEQLARDLAGATGRGARLSAETVARMHAEATAALIAAEGVGLSVGAAFGGVGVAAAQAVLARPVLSRAFRSIRSDAVDAVDRLIAQAVLEGRGPDALERSLRQYLAAEAPAGRARLIARTEIMNAQHEAAVRSAEVSPVVAGLHWKLSSRHTIPCECEPLAELDLFGLGPGVYDPRAVPAKPHPRCLCYTRDVLRPVSEWGTPRAPLVVRDPDWGEIENSYALSPSKLRSLQSAWAAATERVAVAA